MSALPPLIAIRAFEVAARYLSFTRAARELNVTQSAISRHIRLLEDTLGQRLFVRKHRSLALTPAGEEYYAELGGLFRRLASATDKMMRKTRRDRLHIHSYTTFAMHWLIPRLARFQEANPEIEFELTVSSRLVDFELEQVHGVIRTGAGEFEKADRLFPINLLPICSPSRWREPISESASALLESGPLLHSVAASLNWSTWTAGVNEPDLRFSPGFRFESSAMAYLAAARGLGFALGQWEFIQDNLADGTLKVAVPKVVFAARAHYFVRLPRYHNFGPLTRFRDWLLSEIEAEATTRDAMQQAGMQLHHEES